jgi:hypothetical protein
VNFGKVLNFTDLNRLIFAEKTLLDCVYIVKKSIFFEEFELLSAIFGSNFMRFLASLPYRQRRGFSS